MIPVLTFMACHCSSGVASEYNAFGRRDPFVPLVGVPREGTKGGILGILTIDDVVLQGIVVGPDGARNAIINGEVLKEKDRVERLFVESIGDNTVTVKIDDDRFELKLYEEDG
ncbi:MAG: hypothetical protein DRP85_01180 [Candidatus Makaraimicrobium thalassicum]|nr:MAG: hypothetical protein DRP85_01180 [Candidatus Omnitrophota bacterium]